MYSSSKIGASSSSRLVADDERPDQLLADVLDEPTAEAWLRSGEPEAG